MMMVNESSAHVSQAAIAVLLCSYNSNETLPEAVLSVLASHLPVDLFVIDDGSETPVSEVLQHHPRLFILRPARRLGLIGALNFGLDHILPLNYRYIARMDADDICYPQRFARQLEFLENNPEVGVVGTWGRAIHEASKEALFFYNFPSENKVIRRRLFYNNCFIHPSLCLRAELFRKYGGYREAYPAAEDYEIMRRFAQKTKMANIPEYLLDYRISSNGISQSKRRRQLLTRFKIQREYVRPFCLHSYLGIMKTLCMFLIPNTLITELKHHLGKYAFRPTGKKGTAA